VKALIEKVPDIITAAAASNLGIVALLVIAFAVLAYLFFRRARDVWKFASLILLSLGAFAFGVAAFREARPVVGPHHGEDEAPRTLPSNAGDAALERALHRWNSEAERARAASTIVPNSPIPTELSAARSEFEMAWREAPLSTRKQLDPLEVSKGLSYLNRLYRLQEADSSTQTNANLWADEGIGFFGEIQDRKLLTDALLDKAAIYLDLAQLGNNDKNQFEQMAKAGDAVMVRAFQIAVDEQKPEVLRLTSRFYYSLARPQTFRLSDAWDNNYLILAYQKAKEAYERAPADIKNANQLARTVIKVSKNPPQDRDPQWTEHLRTAKDRLKQTWDASKERLTGLDQRLSPLNVLGVVTLETVAREWRDGSQRDRHTKGLSYLAEIDTDALTPLREAAALIQNSELRKAYGFDLYYDIARALAVRTAILQTTSPQAAASTFEEVRRNLSIAKEAAKTSQLEAALKDLDRETTFVLLSAKERRSLSRLISVAQAK
jgi:hypothetical protein